VETSHNLGVYVSVPFCRAKCSFCNFASGVAKTGEIEAYVARLCAEIDAAADHAQRLGARLPHSVDTVYFGGGTPSLLSPAQLQRVFESLRRNFDVTSDAEITLEAAPGQIADDVLAAAMRLGVNRVSLGVQSFVDRECAAVGRLHTGEDCLREIARLRAAGVAEAGADLIAGLPHQTAASWERSLDAAVTCDLRHLSVYLLEIDEDSRLGREVIAGGQRLHAHGLPQEELAVELYERACERLPEAGFAQYEISNFARPGSPSRHNVKYWQREPYIGFGLDAHSMLPLRKAQLLMQNRAVRFANAGDLGEYLAAGTVGFSPSALRAFGREDTSPVSTRVDERDAFEETIFLGLRMCEGLSAGRLRTEFRREWVAPFEDAARELVREGLMAEQDGAWRLTLRGRLVSNEVFGHLLEGVAA
jgi:oxygen-independent coproporphyrinogen-3 oxidase